MTKPFACVPHMKLVSTQAAHCEPCSGVAEDSFAIGAPEDMAAYFGLYADAVLSVDRMETTEVPWCVAPCLISGSFIKVSLR